MILVTGCAGFIGSNLCGSILKEGKMVVGVDNFDNYYDKRIKKNNLKNLLKFKSCNFLPLDITDKISVEKLFSKYKFSTVVHLAARPGVSASINNPLPYVSINILGTLVLLEQMKKINNVPFIFGSSSSVYGGLKKTPFSESDPIELQLSPYGASKKSAEIFCRLYHDIYGIPVTILRFFTVYGPGVRPDMAVMKFIKAIQRREEITLYNRGEVRRDYTYIDDIVDGIKRTINKKYQFEIINLGGSNPVRMQKIVRLLEENLGKSAKIKSAPLPQSEMPETWADITKAKKILLWEPKTTIEVGIKKLISCGINHD